MPYVVKRDLAIGILLQDQPVCLRRSTHSRHGLSPFVVDCPLRACVVDWRQRGGEKMNLPSFTEFLATLNHEVVAGIMKDANNAAKLVKAEDLLDPFDEGPLQLQSLCWQTAVELLAVYHEWLRQQL